MPTFIKAGYWKKMQKDLKGWLNLDDFARKYFTEVGAITSSNIEDNNIVTSEDVSIIVSLTQTEYDALATKDATILYVIVEATTTTTTTVI